MKKNILPIALASTLLVAACSPDSITSAGKDDSEKTPIEFSMTDNTSAAVAVNGNTRAGFSVATDVVMQMVATNSSNATKTKTTKTTASAQAAGSAAYSTLSFSGDGSTRYWDDAYGRDTKLSIYAVAVPGKSTTDVSTLNSLPGETTWSTSTTAHTLSWSVTQNSAQSADCIDKEDLVYSNNIKENGTPNGVYRWNFNSNPAGYPSFDGETFTSLTQGQMQFALKDNSVTEGPGKFDKGNLHFVHALSRVTIKVKYGEEFSGSETVSEPTLIGQPYSGTFDVQNGSFTENPTTGNITMYNNTTSQEDGVKSLCVGQVLPGYVINKSSETTNFFSFKLADNTYYVSQAKVYEALATDDNKTKLGSAYAEDKITMTQGQNYVLTITVSKTKIDNITATLAEWTKIEGGSERNNAYLTFDFSSYSTTASTNFDLYRSSVKYDNPQTDANYSKNYEWTKGYKGNSATLTGPEGDSKIWKTNWYFDDNKTFYHFRTVGQEYKDSKYTAREIKTEENSGTHANEEYFDIASGATDGNYHWGAPMAKDKTLSYDKSSKGFDGTGTDKDTHNISEAIGATESEIKLTEVNTLAKIVVNLATSTGDDKVSFKKDNTNAKVEILNIYTAGKVYMGNGLVVTSGARSTDAKEMTASTTENDITETSAKNYTYYVVPQALKEGDSGSETYVTFKITTPDNNVYYVKEKLSEIKASKVTNGTNVSIGQTQDTAIDYWYPNCTYTYTFTVTKAGIDKFTATLVPYTEIEGTNTDISLED